MKDSVIKDDLIEYLKEEYTYEESKKQLDEAKLTLTTVIKVEYANGVKEYLCRDESDNLVKYEIEELFSLNGVVKSLKDKEELAIDVWLKDNNYELTNDGFTRNEIVFSFGEMHKRYEEYLQSL